MAKALWNPLIAMPSGRDFECYHYIDEGGFSMPAFHAHHHFEFFMYISGNTNIAVEEKLYTPEPYTLFIYPPGTMHRCVSRVDIGRYERVYAYTSRKCIESMSTPDFPMMDIIDDAMQAHLYSFRLSAQVGSMIAAQIDTIIQQYQLTDPADILLNRCRFNMLLIDICRLINPDTEETRTVPNRVRDIISYINEHLTEPLTLEALANHFFVNKYYLLHMFKEYTSLSVHQYIIRKRLICAQKLMLEGMSPGDAACAGGFNDYAGFYRAFVKQTGVSPQAFRKGEAYRALPQSEEI